MLPRHALLYCPSFATPQNEYAGYFHVCIRPLPEIDENAYEISMAPGLLKVSLRWNHENAAHNGPRHHIIHHPVFLHYKDSLKQGFVTLIERTQLYGAKYKKEDGNIDSINTYNIQDFAAHKAKIFPRGLLRHTHNVDIVQIRGMLLYKPLVYHEALVPVANERPIVRGGLIQQVVEAQNNDDVEDPVPAPQPRPPHLPPVQQVLAHRAQQQLVNHARAIEAQRHVQRREENHQRQQHRLQEIQRQFVHMIEPQHQPQPQPQLEQLLPYVAKLIAEGAISKQETCGISYEPLTMGNISVLYCGHYYATNVYKIHAQTAGHKCPACMRPSAPVEV